MIINRELKLKMPIPSNYLIVDNGIFGQKQDGFKEAEKIDIGELTEDQFEDFLQTMEANYRVHWNRRRSNLNKVQ